MIPVIRDGLARCAERLSHICRAEWAVESLRLDDESLDGFAALLDGISEDHYGMYCSMPGAAFLIILDRRSGLRVCTRFLGDVSEQMVLLRNMEPMALGEVASILSNALAESLAAASGSTCLISPPMAMVDNTRALLQRSFKKFREAESIATVSHGLLVCPDLQSELTAVVLLGDGLVSRIGAS